MLISGVYETERVISVKSYSETIMKRAYPIEYVADNSNEMAK